MIMLRMCLPVLLLFLVPLFAQAYGVEVAGQSRTYLLMRETTSSTRLMPLYEYLNFKADSADAGPFSFDFGGWYRHDLQNESNGDNNTGELQYAFLRLKKSTSNAVLDLGRVQIHEGVASELLDGLHGRADLKGGFTVAAYGGSPVETRYDSRRGDTLAGGRIAQGMPGLYTIGVSHLDEKNNSSSFRREEGIDLWLRPVSKVELQGTSAYNALGRGWMEHQYYVTLGPFADLRVNGELSQIDYKQYFSPATMSAFAFTSIDPREKLTTTGGSLEYAATSALTIVADHRFYTYSIAGAADYFGGKVIYSNSNFSAGLNAHRMNGSIDRLKYDELGVYASTKLAKADISAQLFHVAFKEEINGVKAADSASAAAGFAFTPAMRLVADVEYATNPDVTRDVRGMATFVYRFDEKFEKKAPQKRTDAPKRK